jgi:MinD-like ATPase involved in chromosome partitioning or flagellar assembly
MSMPTGVSIFGAAPDIPGPDQDGSIQVDPILNDDITALSGLGTPPVETAAATPAQAHTSDTRVPLPAVNGDAATIWKPNKRAAAHKRGWRFKIGRPKKRQPSAEPTAKPKIWHLKKRQPSVEPTAGPKKDRKSLGAVVRSIRIPRPKNEPVSRPPGRGIRLVLFPMVFWITWGHFELKPNLTERGHRASRTIRLSEFRGCKMVSFFAFKGGVGKTTLAALTAATLKWVKTGLNVLLQDGNTDNGTLSDRMILTTKHIMTDVIKNLPYIHTIADFNVYTSDSEGVKTLASNRDDEFDGITDVKPDEFKALVECELDLFEVVITDLGTSTEAASNLVSLRHSAAIVIPTTPSKVNVKKAMNTFAWLLSQEEYRDLALNHLVLVVNRRMPWSSLKRINARFVEKFGDQFNNVAVHGVSYSFSMGHDKVPSPSHVSKRIRVQLLELSATLCQRTADFSTENPDSQLTHMEMVEQGLLDALSPVNPDVGT